MINFFIDRFGVEEGTNICNAFSYFLERFGGQCKDEEVLGILEALYTQRHGDKAGITLGEVRKEILEALEGIVLVPFQIGRLTDGNAKDK